MIKSCLLLPFPGYRRLVDGTQMTEIRSWWLQQVLKEYTMEFQRVKRSKGSGWAWCTPLTRVGVNRLSRKGLQGRETKMGKIRPTSRHSGHKASHVSPVRAQMAFPPKALSNPIVGFVLSPVLRRPCYLGHLLENFSLLLQIYLCGSWVNTPLCP